MNRIVIVGRRAVSAAVLAVLLGACGAAETLPTSSQEPIETGGATSEGTSSPIAAPPLTQSFTSTQHGISMSYPEGWVVQAATAPWTDSTFPLSFGAPHADWLSDPDLESNLFLTVASQPIGDATPEDWVAQQLGNDEGCDTTEPTDVGGAEGSIGTDGCDIAVVTTDGRGYWIQLYTSDDDPSAVAPYDTAWFEELLATVELHPEEAVD